LSILIYERKSSLDIRYDKNVEQVEYTYIRTSKFTKYTV